jgi:hypothetical protein
MDYSRKNPQAEGEIHATRVDEKIPSLLRWYFLADDCNFDTKMRHKISQADSPPCPISYCFGVVFVIEF